MHISVLKKEIDEFLKASEGGIFFDGTVGMGGHSTSILNACPQNYLYGTDKDSDALEIARKNLQPFPHRFTLFHSDFKAIETLPIPIETIDGFLFDLGVSSFQLDNPVKGFSYAREAPLDMRMNKQQDLTAYQVVNDYTYEQLFRILKEYGEFPNPSRIVEQIVFHRKTKKIETTDQLKTIIRRVAPQQKTMDPLARVFQAVRIEVNRELSGLEEFFLRLFNKMKPGSRVAVISFHSLEDRVVKSVLKHAKENNIMETLTRKPILPASFETETNPRARSAKLRVGERLG
jgi:16S rRNA (cytosine1402-N4)-methyltransferase